MVAILASRLICWIIIIVVGQTTSEKIYMDLYPETNNSLRHHMIFEPQYSQDEYFRYKNIKTSGMFVVDFMDDQHQFHYTLAHKFCTANGREGTLRLANQDEELEFLWFVEFNPEKFVDCPMRWTTYRKILDTEWRSMDNKITAFGSLSAMWSKGKKFAGMECVVVDFTMKLKPVSCQQPTVCFLCELDLCNDRNRRCFKLMSQNVASADEAHRTCKKRGAKLAPVRGYVDFQVILQFIKKRGGLKKDNIFRSTKRCHTVTLGMKAQREYETYLGEKMDYESRLISMRKGYFNDQCLVFSPSHFFRLVPEHCRSVTCALCRKKSLGDILVPP